MLAASAQPRLCSVCNVREFFPKNSMHRVCSQRCATKLAKAAETARKLAQKVEKAQDRAKKEKLKRIPDLLREAQSAFNSWVRARDAGKPCICCGRLPASDAGGVRSHNVDAGHYRSIGSASHLRFDERNVHSQLVLCNRWGAGRAVDYRIGLIARIGLAAVEALEANNTPHKWERDELRQIAAEYRAKLKALKANNEE